jgi:hypothetical protein
VGEISNVRVPAFLLTVAAVIILGPHGLLADESGAAPRDNSVPTENFVPRDGFVPNAETAMRIAEAVWIPIYGEDRISSEKPFNATLTNDIWTVTGADLPPGTVGGVAEAQISKRDGRIVRVIHGQ